MLIGEDFLRAEVAYRAEKYSEERRKATSIKEPSRAENQGKKKWAVVSSSAARRARHA